MIEHDTDEARLHRQKRLVEVRPTAAKDALREWDYENEYEKPHVITADNLEAIEATQKCLFCPACRQTTKNGLTKVRKLHMSYGPDLLSNYPMIATARCAGCGWSEMIPAIKEAPTSEEIKLSRDWREKQDSDEYAASWRQIGISQMQMQNASQYAAMHQQMEQIRRYAVDAQRMAVMPPIIRFGQQFADDVWKRFDEIDMIKAEAARQMEYLKREAAKQSATLTVEHLRAVKEKLERQDKIKIGPNAPNPTPHGPPRAAMEIYNQMRKKLGL